MVMFDILREISKFRIALGGLVALWLPYRPRWRTNLCQRSPWPR
jgi:hypothetical protein